MRYGGKLITCCVVLSPVGIVFLGVLSALLFTGSRSIEMPSAHKKQRGKSGLVATGVRSIKQLRFLRFVKIVWLYVLFINCAFEAPSHNKNVCVFG